MHTTTKDTGTGTTTIEFACHCGNHWEARARWEASRIVLLDPASERCGNCGDEGVAI